MEGSLEIKKNWRNKIHMRLTNVGDRQRRSNMWIIGVLEKRKLKQGSRANTKTYH